MDFSNIPLLSIMKTKLQYMSERQSTLAQNIANADTPKYRAKDLAAPDFKKMAAANGQPVQKLQLTTTNPKHVVPTTSASAFKVIKREKTDELNPDGNNVSVEEEMAKVAENQADYQTTLNLYSKMVTMFKTAIGNPGTTQ